MLLLNLPEGYIGTPSKRLTALTALTAICILFFLFLSFFLLSLKIKEIENERQPASERQ